MASIRGGWSHPHASLVDGFSYLSDTLPENKIPQRRTGADAKRNKKETMPPLDRTPKPPPWEALVLVAQSLDPKSLALASCVSKSWQAAMSADHLWRPILLAHYPSARQLSPFSSRALFALLRSASALRRCAYSVPRISLNDLIFIFDVFHNETPVLSLAKPGEEINSNAVFHFDVKVIGEAEIAGAVEELRVAWTVVMKGFRAAFTMMEGVKKGRWIGTSALWFSEELPGPASGLESASASFMAELGLEFCTEESEAEKRRVGRMRMGLMGVVGCRYVGLMDGLLYLQSFLLPSNI